jgi:outer membrane protein OmpA-like peptidoglycan-associated protein
MQLNRALPTIGIILGCLCCLAGYGRAMTTEAFVNELLSQPAATQTQAIQKEKRGVTRGIKKVTVGCIDERQPQVAMRLQFGLDSATLQPEAVAELDRLAAALEDTRLHSYKFILAGHTCDLGSDAHNLELSKRRAYAVADYLTSHARLSPGQFEVTWFGEEYPLVKNTDENARRQNRRVVIKNTLKKADIALQGRPITLELTRNHKGQVEILSDGDTLPSGSTYAVSFKTATKAYAYICLQDAGGKTDLIFPSPGFSRQVNPITPGQTYRIPSGTHANGFIFDNTIGMEQFAMLALDTPLQDPVTVCSIVLKSNANRGLGGTTPIVDKASSPATGDILRLCRIVPGGQTRGVQGIVGIDGPSPAPAAIAQEADGSCQGFFLTRFFYHQ